MILAQDQFGHSAAQIFMISLLLIGMLVAGCVAVMAVKRRLSQPDDLSGAAGFTLSDLRQMRKTGQISDEEFEKAKGLIVGASRHARERETPGSADGDLSIARQRAADRSRQESTDDPAHLDE